MWIRKVTQPRLSTLRWPGIKTSCCGSLIDSRAAKIGKRPASLLNQTIRGSIVLVCYFKIAKSFFPFFEASVTLTFTLGFWQRLKVIILAITFTSSDILKHLPKADYGKKKEWSRLVWGPRTTSVFRKIKIPEYIATSNEIFWVVSTSIADFFGICAVGVIDAFFAFVFAPLQMLNLFSLAYSCQQCTYKKKMT